MTRKNLLVLFSVFAGAAFVFSSCSGSGDLTIQKRRYSNGFYVHRSSTPDASEKSISENAQSAAALQPEAAPATAAITAAEPQPAQASASAVQPAAQPAVAKSNRSAVHAPAAAEKQSRPDTKVSESSKPAVSTTEKPVTPTDADTNLVLLVILAIIIPPVAVFLKDGLSTNFWISLILTLLFWVPGVIFALLVVFDVI
jgi:uncharacterized membrane protein YqaE (UPF0057 family)